MTHALVIGGTGMLRAATLQLLREFEAVSVVARTQSRLDSLAIDVGGGVRCAHPICVDWADTDGLRAGVRDAIGRYGSISLVVSWVHSSAPDAPGAVADLVEDANEPPRWFQIYGTSGEASQVGKSWHADLSGRAGLRYRRVRLGSVETGDGGRRWLTHEEISAGVLEAVSRDLRDSLAGN